MYESSLFDTSNCVILSPDVICRVKGEKEIFLREVNEAEKDFDPLVCGLSKLDLFLLIPRKLILIRRILCLSFSLCISLEFMGGSYSFEDSPGRYERSSAVVCAVSKF